MIYQVVRAFKWWSYSPFVLDWIWTNWMEKHYVVEYPRQPKTMKEKNTIHILIKFFLIHCIVEYSLLIICVSFSSSYIHFCLLPVCANVTKQSKITTKTLVSTNHTIVDVQVPQFFFPIWFEYNDNVFISLFTLRPRIDIVVALLFFFVSRFRFSVYALVAYVTKSNVWAVSCFLFRFVLSLCALFQHFDSLTGYKPQYQIVLHQFPLTVFFLLSISFSGIHRENHTESPGKEV